MLSAVTANGLAMEQAPDVLVRQTTEAVLERIRSDPEIAAGNRKRINEVVETLLIDHFDFERMTRLAVGKNWRSVDETKKSDLVREFRTLLVRTYSVALSAYRDQELEYPPLTLAADTKSAMVQTTITQSGSTPISINYRMAETATGWKVYDVIIDGVSLVINYRSSFNSTVESSGVDGLIQLLQDKNAGSE